ncbi:hypothetical protein [Spirosoma foliorum]|uniref:hypothetical protein n=1 Tax=Spirosoma foliorum TaxID=2710596 RepID=UPI00403F4D53
MLNGRQPANRRPYTRSAFLFSLCGYLTDQATTGGTAHAGTHQSALARPIPGQRSVVQFRCVLHLLNSIHTMQPYQQHSAPLTATVVLACTALALAVSLALITAALFMLTNLKPPQIAVTPIF